MSQVLWTAQFLVNEGSADELRAFVREQHEIVKDEPGTVEFGWFISDDGTQAHTRETYRDEDAARAHIETFEAQFAERLMALVEPAGFFVYFEPSPKFAAELAAWNPVILPPA